MHKRLCNGSGPGIRVLDSMTYGYDIWLRYLNVIYLGAECDVIMFTLKGAAWKRTV